MSGTYSAAELLSLCALNRVNGIGPRTFVSLLDKFGTATRVLNASTDEWLQAGVAQRLHAALHAPDWIGAQRDLNWLAGEQRHILVLGDADYPSQLAAIPAAPPLLFVHGSLSVLKTPQLAIVGSRKPTSNGLRLAEQFAQELSALGLSIVSGLALGIDAAAHWGALTGRGLTVAVAGTGLDHTYPARHRDLAAKIYTAGGALVSEFPIGTPPAAQNFPRRNRIISGLSLGVLVVEAAMQSGSLITAKFALEQGREVFAIPGSIYNGVARGCHALIREGAKLVESVADISIELTGSFSQNSVSFQQPIVEGEGSNETGDGLSAEYQSLLEKLGYDPTTVDVLVDRTGLTARVLSSMLLILELKGYVSSQAGGVYVRQGTR